MKCRKCGAPMSDVLFQARVPLYCTRDCTPKQAAPGSSHEPWHVVYYLFEEVDELRSVQEHQQVPLTGDGVFYLYSQPFDPTMVRYKVPNSAIIERRAVALPGGGHVTKLYVPCGTRIERY